MKRYQPQKVYLSAADLAERYDVHLVTVFKWAKQGIIPPGELIARGTRPWRRDEIEAFDNERAARARG